MCVKDGQEGSSALPCVAVVTVGATFFFIHQAGSSQIYIVYLAEATRNKHMDYVLLEDLTMQYLEDDGNRLPNIRDSQEWA